MLTIYYLIFFAVRHQQLELASRLHHNLLLPACFSHHPQDRQVELVLELLALPSRQHLNSQQEGRFMVKEPREARLQHHLLQAHLLLAFKVKRSCTKK